MKKLNDLVPEPPIDSLNTSEQPESNAPANTNGAAPDFKLYEDYVRLRQREQSWLQELEKMSWKEVESDNKITGAARERGQAREEKMRRRQPGALRQSAVALYQGAARLRKMGESGDLSALPSRHGDWVANQSDAWGHLLGPWRKKVPGTSAFILGPKQKASARPADADEVIGIHFVGDSQMPVVQVLYHTLAPEQDLSDDYAAARAALKNLPATENGGRVLQSMRRGWLTRARQIIAYLNAHDGSVRVFEETIGNSRLMGGVKFGLRAIDRFVQVAASTVGMQRKGRRQRYVPPIDVREL